MFHVPFHRASCLIISNAVPLANDSIIVVRFISYYFDLQVRTLNGTPGYRSSSGTSLRSGCEAGAAWVVLYPGRNRTATGNLAEDGCSVSAAPRGTASVPAPDPEARTDGDAHRSRHLRLHWVVRRSFVAPAMEMRGRRRTEHGPADERRRLSSTGP